MVGIHLGNLEQCPDHPWDLILCTRDTSKICGSISARETKTT